MKGLPFDKLFGLRIKTTKEFVLASTKDETAIQVTKRRVLFLQRVGAANWVEKI